MSDALVAAHLPGRVLRGGKLGLRLLRGRVRLRPEPRKRPSLTANFRQLVLGCMDSYDSDQWLILQGFSKSTRFAFFCAAPISKFADFCMQFLQNCAEIFRSLQNFATFSAKTPKILTKICCISAIRAVQKNANLVDFEKFCKMRLSSL